MTTSTLMLTIGAVLAIGFPCHAGKLPQAERLRSEAYQKLHPDKKITPAELEQAKQSIERLAVQLRQIESTTADSDTSTAQRFCEQLALNLDTIVRRGTIHATLPDETFTAMHFAVCLGLTDVAEILLQNGADPDATDEYGSPPLLRNKPQCAPRWADFFTRRPKTFTRRVLPLYVTS